ncbi:hypothetical protein ACOMX4_002544 [Enterococcus faecalis]
MKHKFITSLLVSVLCIQLMTPLVSMAQTTQISSQTGEATTASTADSSEASGTTESSMPSTETSSIEKSSQSLEQTQTSEEHTSSNKELPVSPTAPLPTPQPSAGETKADPALTLPEDYEEGKSADKIIRTVNGEILALTWFANNIPMLTRNGTTYIYRSSLDMSLIVNKNFSLGDGSSSGIFQNTRSVKRVFGHNENSLYQAFYFDDTDRKRFKMEVIQKFNDDQSANVTYTLHNLNEENLQIGLHEYADLLVGNDRVPVTPINNFKGISLQYQSGPRLSILPKDFENWTVGEFRAVAGFNLFTPKTAEGKGWETGFLGGDPAQPLNENVPVSVGDSGLSMKSVGKEIAPNGSISFEQQLKYGLDKAPDMTLEETEYTVPEGKDVTVSGEAWDEDTEEFKVVLIDSETNIVVASQDFVGVTLGQKQPFQLIIPADKLKLGNNAFIARVSDKWGEKKEVPVTVTVEKHELSFTVPKSLTFQETKLNGKQQLAPREEADWHIDVVNTAKATWQVKAQATAMKGTNNQAYNDALTFVDKEGEKHSLAETTFIAQGKPSDTAATIQWEENQGVLFAVDPTTMKADTYTGKINWTLEVAP